jgi:hypothetical protein
LLDKTKDHESLVVRLLHICWWKDKLLSMCWPKPFSTFDRCSDLYVPLVPLIWLVWWRFYGSVHDGLFVCLFNVLRPAQEFFTYMETAPLPKKACKFRPMLGAQGLWAERDLYLATPTVTRDLGFSGLIWRPPHSVASDDTHGNAEDLL